MLYGFQLEIEKSDSSAFRFLTNTTMDPDDALALLEIYSHDHTSRVLSIQMNRYNPITQKDESSVQISPENLRDICYKHVDPAEVERRAWADFWEGSTDAPIKASKYAAV